MSIDYDELRKWLVEVDQANPLPGDTVTFSYPFSSVEIIRELVRLHDGVERVQDMCLLERDAAFQETPMRGGEVTAFNVCAEQLDELLKGSAD